jgi:hypothetical protein
VLAAGYDAAFMSLGAIAGVGLALYLFAMPETADRAVDEVSRGPSSVPSTTTGIAAPER